MKKFEEAGTFRKSNGELQEALNNPQEAKKKLQEAHGHNGQGDEPSIRIQGDPKKSLELIKKLDELGIIDKEEAVDGIYKNYEDKDKRENFDSSEIRAYINPQ